MFSRAKSWILLPITIVALSVLAFGRPRSNGAARQPTPISTGGLEQAVALPCNGCAWDYHYAFDDSPSSPARLQVLPVGTAGVLHAIDLSCNSSIGEGDANDPDASVMFATDDTIQQSRLNSLEIAFSNGLWVAKGSQPNCEPPLIYKIMVRYRPSTEPAPRDCIRCGWSYRWIKVPSGGPRRVQVVEPGVSGVFHSAIWLVGGENTHVSLTGFGEGDMNDPNATLISANLNAGDIDVSFTNGLWVAGPSNPTLPYRSTVLFRTNQPVSTDPVEP
jgi:hypothetical protein